jgi:hypothetical protein
LILVLLFIIISALLGQELFAYKIFVYFYLFEFILGMVKNPGLVLTPSSMDLSWCLRFLRMKNGTSECMSL